MCQEGLVFRCFRISATKTSIKILVGWLGIFYNVRQLSHL